MRSRTRLTRAFVRACVMLLVAGCGGRSSIELLGSEPDSGVDSGAHLMADAGRDAGHDSSVPPPVDSGRNAHDARPTVDAAKDTAGPIDAPRETTAPDVCVPQSCLDLGFNCGSASDGCGGTLPCGTCTLPLTCGGEGIPNVCGEPCVPITCASQGFVCGLIGDGCGTTINCGTCPDGGTCGGNGVPGQCSACVTGCVPWTCADLPSTNPLNGPVGDGCGNVIVCDTCACVYPGLPASCNGAVTMPPNAWLDPDCCGVANCLPETCEEEGIGCGFAGDGCGDLLYCGTCNPDGTCPMGGTAGACMPCTPRTCASAGLNCGTNDDGCGGTIDCGTCDPCIPCNAGVCAGVLISQCVPATCESLGLDCGAAGDGCGNALDCGTCAAPLTCARGACVPFCM